MSWGITVKTSVDFERCLIHTDSVPLVYCSVTSHLKWLHDMQASIPWTAVFTNKLTSNCKLVTPTIECSKLEGTQSIQTHLWPQAAPIDRLVPNPEAHMIATDKVSCFYYLNADLHLESKISSPVHAVQFHEAIHIGHSYGQHSPEGNVNAYACKSASASNGMKKQHLRSNSRHNSDCVSLVI